MQRGEIWWADFGEPVGSEPGFTRPVLIMQSNDFNDTDLRTIVVVAITSNLRLANMPGNVLVERRPSSPFSRDSVINVTQITTIDRSILRDMIGRLPVRIMSDVESGIRLVLGL